jgi:hypothetical protein
MWLVMGDYWIETEGKAIKYKLKENWGEMFYCIKLKDKEQNKFTAILLMHVSFYNHSSPEHTILGGNYILPPQKIG